jgi:NADH dehydrogenase [ubiquinone] 1 alpha subcomplex assembly factor 5
LILVDSEAVSVEYPNVFSMLQDLRLMGASNALSVRSGAFSANLLQNLEKYYEYNFRNHENGNFPLTFCIIYFMGWTG